MSHHLCFYARMIVAGYDKPLLKYLDLKTVLIYRPHPVGSWPWDLLWRTSCRRRWWGPAWASRWAAPWPLFKGEKAIQGAA
jgi:hypothetical protein